MHKSGSLDTQCWLLMGMMNANAQLTLAGERIRLTADSGILSEGDLRKLETRSGRAGLADRLSNGGGEVLFDVSRTEIRDVTPWYYSLGGLKLRIGDATYRISFTRPNDSSQGLVALVRARRTMKAWRAALKQ